MRIGINPAGLRKTRWYEYAVRFVFGGLVTAMAGIIAKKFGPGVGGLFLAFPAIFPASATLIEKHEKQKKERAGFDGTISGRKAAAADAAGSATGNIGLFVFAMLVWQFLPRYSAWVVLVSITMTWLIVVALSWKIRKTI